MVPVHKLNIYTKIKKYIEKCPCMATGGEPGFLTRVKYVTVLPTWKYRATFEREEPFSNQTFKVL